MKRLILGDAWNLFHGLMKSSFWIPVVRMIRYPSAINIPIKYMKRTGPDLVFRSSELWIKLTGDWVLSIDADEMVTPELRTEIEQALQQKEFQGYEIPRLSSYCGRQMRHGGWWPDYVLRLFRRDCGQFTDSVVHERIIVQGQTGQLTTPLLHDAFVSLDEVLHKVNCYSSLGAEMLYQKGVRSSISKAIFKALWTFVRTYFLKLAIMDGRQGLLLSISNAEGTYYKYVKLLELQSRQAQQ